MQDWRVRFKQRMDELKESEGLTQQALAERLGRSQTLISKWLRGEREPSVEDLERIAICLGVTTQWLMHGLGAPDPITHEILEILTHLDKDQRTALLAFIKRE